MHVLQELSERQHGLVATHQLRAMEVKPHLIFDLCRSSNWFPVTQSVFRRLGAPITEEQAALSAVLDCGPGAVLSHTSAAALWGHGGFRLTGPTHVTRVSRSGCGTDLAIVHTVRSLPARWVGLLRGIPVVRPEFLALQLFATLHEARAERVVESLWAMRLFSGRSLACFLDDLGRRGRNGTAALRRYHRDRGVGYVPTASGLETRVMQILRDADIPVRRQVDSGGHAWTGRVDFLHRELPLVIEVQSERFHSALVDRHADAHRIEQLRADGFDVVEITDAQVWSAPHDVVATVRAACSVLRGLG